ncbi:MAG: hypothetical protein IPL60_12205 [Ardenticatenia bacterium]|nr:hypothetical protein [Ardenticatenia bacterium]
MTAKDWINTNTPEAMRVGLDEFRKMDASEALANRLKAMLIVTDGRANLPDKKAEMPGLVREQADALKSAGVELYVVGLNDADNYWLDGDGAFWETMTGPGRAILAETASTRIAQIYRELLADWLKRLQSGGSSATPGGPTSTPDPSAASCISDPTYSAPPYLRQLAFVVSYGVPRSSLTITAPDGLPVSRASGSPSTGTSARFERRDPPSGTYAIIKDPTKYYCIVAEQVGPQINRVSPGPSVDPGSEQSIVFQALRHDGKPQGLLPDWPVDAGVDVTAPDGTVQMLVAELGADGTITSKWTPQMPGQHQLRISGRVTLPSGNYDIFSQSPSYEQVVEVSDKNPVWLDLVSPDADTRSISVVPWAPQLVTAVRVTSGSSGPIGAIGDAVSDPENWLTAQRIDVDGLPLGDAVHFTAAVSDTLQAELAVPLGWDVLLGRAEERVLISSDANRLKTAHTYAGIRGGGDMAGFISNNGANSTIGPIAVTIPAWARMGLWVLPALLLLAMLGAVGYIVGPGLLVWREDKAQAQDVALWIFDGLNDPNGYTARKFSVTGWHRFNLDKELTLRIDGTEHIAQRLRVTREPSAGAAMAQVEYRWPDDKKVHRAFVKAGSPPKQLEGIDADHWVIALRQFK